MLGNILQDLSVPRSADLFARPQKGTKVTKEGIINMLGIILQDFHYAAQPICSRGRKKAQRSQKKASSNVGEYSAKLSEPPRSADLISLVTFCAFLRLSFRNSVGASGVDLTT